MAKIGRRDSNSGDDVIVRAVLEGVERTSTAPMITQIEKRFRTRRQDAPAPVGDAMVQLWSFPAEQVGGRGLTYELFQLRGAVDRATQRDARRKVDSIMAVVATPSAGSPMTRRLLSEIVEDVMSMAPQARPLVNVLVDLDEANPAGLTVEELKADLRLPEAFDVLSATGPQGYLYCFGRITQNAIRRYDDRRARGLPATRALGMDGLLGALEPDRDNSFAPPRPTMPLPAQPLSSAPPLPIGQPLQSIIAPPPPSTGPTVVIGAGPRKADDRPDETPIEASNEDRSHRAPILRLVPPPTPDPADTDPDTDAEAEAEAEADTEIETDDQSDSDPSPTPGPVRFEPRRSRPNSGPTTSAEPVTPPPSL